MVHIKSLYDLKKFLITSQLVRMDQWQAVESELVNGESVQDILQIMERRQILTSLQTSRILKGTTEGLILGKYKLLYRNASGSFARVYRAETLDGQDTVAVKLLRERWAADPEAVAGFHREARICQRFLHPNIVPIYDVGSEGRYHYFTMEFVEGGNLRDFLRVRKSVNAVEAVRCVYEICSGLEYALTQGATHRDLKLTNVLMSSDGTAKLVDFGLAGANSPTQAGTSDDVHRALEYASLERGTNAPDNDPRSDIFFAGAILYELLSGKPAWARTSDREERKQLRRYTSTPPLASVCEGLPTQVYEIVTGMMQVNPNDRYQSASEVCAALRGVLIELGAWSGEVPTMQQPVAEQPEAARSGRQINLLVVDSVKQRIKALTEYFSRHNFQLSFVNHPTVALDRLKRPDTPEAVLILADNFTAEAISEYPQIQAYARSKKVPCLAVFPKEERTNVDRAVRSTRYGATAFQPSTLREIRTHFENLVNG